MYSYLTTDIERIKNVTELGTGILLIAGTRESKELMKWYMNCSFPKIDEEFILCGYFAHSKKSVWLRKIHRYLVISAETLFMQILYAIGWLN